MRIAYLDNSATTRVCGLAAQKVYEVMTQRYGNPSSLHTKGLEAERELTLARAQLSEMLGCRPGELYFTSGGTEANNLAILGGAAARRRQGNRVVVSAIEHSSVLEPAKELEKQGFEVIYLSPNHQGIVEREEIFKWINSSTVLVSLQLVNNELGTVQPVEALSAAVRRAKAPALIHVDAVQAFGKIPVKPNKLGADLLTVSGHKIHGPKGVGALFVAKDVHILPRTFGGGQEKKLRPGTESVPLIAGFGAAAAALPELSESYDRIEELKKLCMEELEQMEGIVINSPERSVPYILNISVPGIRSETMLHHLAAQGVYVSSGSACSKGQKSHVLRAAGFPEGLIDSALRISFSHENTQEDVRQLLDGVKSGLATLARARK